MPSITVKNIPEEIYDRVCEQANAHHGSINSEIIACLEQTVKPQQVSTDDILQEARRLRKKAKGVCLLKKLNLPLIRGVHDRC